MSTVLSPQPLTAEAFAPFGDVIECDNHTPLIINQGYSQRYHNLAKLDLNAEGGQALVSIFRTKAQRYPLELKVMERHPLASQAFIPLHITHFLILVAKAECTIPLKASDLHFFITNGRQGVNYHRNVWHHYNLVIKDEEEFIVIDRGGEGNNLEEYYFAEGAIYLQLD